MSRTAALTAQLGHARARARRGPGDALVACGVGIIALTLVAGAPSIELARTRWLLMILLAFMMVFLIGPSHVLWRPDANIVTRLPLPGRVLLADALAGMRRPTMLGMGVGLIATAGLLRHTAEVLPGLALALGLLGLAWSGSVGAAVLAGHLAVGHITRPASLDVGPLPPPTAMLGALPGAIGAGLLLLAIYANSAPQLTLPVAAGCAGVAAGLPWLLRVTLAPGLPSVVRQIAALDRIHLAPIEVQPPSRLVRLLARRLRPAVALMLQTQAQLLNRRYPLATLVGIAVFGLMASAALWPQGWQTPSRGVALAAALGYAIMLRQRLARPPLAAHLLERVLGLAPASRQAAHLLTQAWLGSFLTTSTLLALALAPVWWTMLGAAAGHLGLAGYAAWHYRGAASPAPTSK